jgi:hypothetical protein
VIDEHQGRGNRLGDAAPNRPVRLDAFLSNAGQPLERCQARAVLWEHDEEEGERDPHEDEIAPAQVTEEQHRPDHQREPDRGAARQGEGDPDGNEDPGRHGQRRAAM